MPIKKQYPGKESVFQKWQHKFQPNSQTLYNNSIITSLPQSHLGRARNYPLQQRMNSSASFATNCAVPTADEFNHSAMGMLHPHCSGTCVLYVWLTLYCLISSSQKKEICPFLNWRYLLPKFPGEQWKNENCL